MISKLNNYRTTHSRTVEALCIRWLAHFPWLVEGLFNYSEKNIGVCPLITLSGLKTKKELKGFRPICFCLCVWQCKATASLIKQAWPKARIPSFFLYTGNTFQVKLGNTCWNNTFTYNFRNGKNKKGRCAWRQTYLRACVCVSVHICRRGLVV